MTKPLKAARTCETCRKRAAEQPVQKWIGIGKVLHLVDQRKPKRNGKTESVCGLHVP
jgi:hypothetical protein